MKKEADGSDRAAKPRRKNMRADEREKSIVTEAVRFFAEVGFEGQTRELAKRMGISHGVIYRHFESKDALIERVYEHVYLQRWNPDWEPLILDRSRPLEERLVQFYKEYALRVFDYDWVRIFVSSGLKSYNLTDRYLAIIRDKIIVPASKELRHELQREPLSDYAAKGEIELFWGLHGSVFYTAIRKFIYNVDVDIEDQSVVENTVRAFFRGIGAVASP